MIKTFHIIEEKPVSLVRVKSILKKRKAAGELTYEQKIAYEHARKFSKLTESRALKLREDLCELGIRRLRPNHIVIILNLLPKSSEELKLITASGVAALKSDEIKRVLEVVKKYCE